MTRNQIREVFLAHGFTIKDGNDDLKPYVYEAAEALLAGMRDNLRRCVLAHVRLNNAIGFETKSLEQAVEIACARLAYSGIGAVNDAIAQAAEGLKLDMRASEADKRDAERWRALEVGIDFFDTEISLESADGGVRIGNVAAMQEWADQIVTRFKGE